MLSAMDRSVLYIDLPERDELRARMLKRDADVAEIQIGEGDALICQECKQRPATMHFTKIINGEKTEFHLCEQCAKEHGHMFTFYGNDEFFTQQLVGRASQLSSANEGNDN